VAISQSKAKKSSKSAKGPRPDKKPVAEIPLAEIPVAEIAVPVIVVMGSQSDWETMRHTVDLLGALKVPVEARIVSAHRTPERLYAFAKGAAVAGHKVIIAGAGGAAHLPGMIAAMTTLPVLGVPVESHALSGMDSLLSIVQMPGGVPVGTLAIGKAGAINAGLLAASILGLSDPELGQRLADWRIRQTAQVGLIPKS
jgi:5-(carboxyamino)imidazole ribonucleotide mutase